MRAISIRELHNRTGHLIRAASDEPLLITERGRKMALLIPFSDQVTSQKSFLQRTLQQFIPLAKGTVDSSVLISEDRDRG